MFDDEQDVMDEILWDKKDRFEAANNVDLLTAGYLKMKTNVYMVFCCIKYLSQRSKQCRDVV
ncbi:MAG TPA: hypothetical protein DEP63_00315 [Candidatus Magasanikbacteria bacterium]|nr:hypothetical protein [Candidatus Magasanikbacteria bacterium]HCC13180.1 hypothetical protein [Candidatus Magasanikbacteria bacterium]HCM53558.1 hypothetical protein [Candidatus Magasanikbacteria bacterium]